MFKACKRKIPLMAIANNIVNNVKIIKGGLDESAQDGGFASNSNYFVESHALSYVLGIYLIQASKFNYADRHRLSASFTGIWANELSNDPSDLKIVPFLQSKLREYYAYAGDDTKSLDVTMALHYMHMLRVIGVNIDDHGAIITGMGAGLSLMLKQMINKLNGIHSKFKLTN